MASKTDLRHRFRDPETPEGTIDVDAVIRRARTRRRPRVLAAAGVSTLAAAAIVVPLTIVGVGSLSPAGPDATLAGGAAESSADSSLTDADATIERAPASRLNLCEGAVTWVDTAASGLALAVPTIAAVAERGPVSLDVTLANTSEAEIRGTVLGEPVLTVSDDDVVVWHSNGPGASEQRPFVLQPGESTSFEARLELVRCEIEDDEAAEFRSDLPPLPAGEYTVSAVLEVDLGDGAGPILVTGPSAPIRVG